MRRVQKSTYKMLARSFIGRQGCKKWLSTSGRALPRALGKEAAFLNRALPCRPGFLALIYTGLSIDFEVGTPFVERLWRWLLPPPLWPPRWPDCTNVHSRNGTLLCARLLESPSVVRMPTLALLAKLTVEDFGRPDLRPVLANALATPGCFIELGKKLASSWNTARG